MPGRLVGDAIFVSLPTGVTVSTTSRSLRRIFRSLQVFSRDDRKAGALMMSTAVLGLLCANFPGLSRLYQAGISWIPLSQLPPANSLHISLGEWIQDGLLTVFFLVTGLDLRQEMTSGSLRHPKQALLPLLAALGGVLAPIALYLLINASSPATISGWAVPTATDVAFSLAALQVIAPKQAPPCKPS